MHKSQSTEILHLPKGHKLNEDVNYYDFMMNIMQNLIASPVAVMMINENAKAVILIASQTNKHQLKNSFQLKMYMRV